MSYLPAPTAPVDADLARLGFLWYGDLLCIREKYIAYVAPTTVEDEETKEKHILWFAQSEHNGRITKRNTFIPRESAVDQAEGWARREHSIMIGLLEEIRALERLVKETEAQVAQRDETISKIRSDASWEAEYNRTMNPPARESW